MRLASHFSTSFSTDPPKTLMLLEPTCKYPCRMGIRPSNWIFVPGGVFRLIWKRWGETSVMSTLVDTIPWLQPHRVHMHFEINESRKLTFFSSFFSGSILNSACYSTLKHSKPTWFMVSISSALTEETPSVSVSLSIRGAAWDSSFAFGAATFRTFCTCVTKGPSMRSSLPACKSGDEQQFEHPVSQWSLFRNFQSNCIILLLLYFDNQQ